VYRLFELVVKRRFTECRVGPHRRIRYLH